MELMVELIHRESEEKAADALPELAMLRWRMQISLKPKDHPHHHGGHGS